MSTRSALIVWGGWDGHEPDKVADLFREILEGESFDVTVESTLDAFLDVDRLNALSLIVPVWTMGTITHEQRDPVCRAVAEHGVGIAGCHGGMCDSFRNDTEWQFMTGGQWVAHPGNDGVEYTVEIDRTKDHPITRGLPDMAIKSEQYYMHVDPAVEVLASTAFPTPGVDGPHVKNPCRMPVVWTKWYGNGRVFYNALGHHRDVLEPETPREIMRRGFLWAARGVGLE
ncbi:MAG: ThuA domain-containing protein [Fimbriimonadaceae bacterium]